MEHCCVPAYIVSFLAVMLTDTTASDTGIVTEVSAAAQVEVSEGTLASSPEQKPGCQKQVSRHDQLHGGA